MSEAEAEEYPVVCAQADRRALATSFGVLVQVRREGRWVDWGEFVGAGPWLERAARNFVYGVAPLP